MKFSQVATRKIELKCSIIKAIYDEGRYLSVEDIKDKVLPDIETIIQEMVTDKLLQENLVQPNVKWWQKIKLKKVYIYYRKGYDFWKESEDD